MSHDLQKIKVLQKKQLTPLLDFLNLWLSIQGIDNRTINDLLQRCTTVNEIIKDPLLFEINQVYHWEILSTHPQVYLQLVLSFETEFQYIVSHKRSQTALAVLTHYGSLINAYGISFLSHLWALSVYQTLIMVDPETHDNLRDANTNNNSLAVSWTLIAFLEQCYINISTINNLLYVKSLTNCNDLTEKLSKDLLHKVIRSITETLDNQLFTTSLEEFATILDPCTHTGLTKKILKKQITPAERNTLNFKKITVLHIIPTLKSKRLMGLWLFKEPPQISSRENTHSVHGLFWLFGHQLLSQKKTKDPTTVTYTFIDKIKPLHQTAIHPCPTMIKHTRLLMEQDYEQLVIKLENFLTETKLETQLCTQTYNQLLTNVYKKKVIYQRINATAQMQVNAGIEGLQTKLQIDSAALIHNLLMFTNELSNTLTPKLTKSYINYQQTVELLIQLQNFLSKIRLLNNALHFFDTLENFKLKQFYYSIYSDFRGRLYYKSYYSPQAYWYYRFFYHFGEITYYPSVINSNLIPPSWISKTTQKDLLKYGLFDTNIISILYSIGLLFKTKLVNNSTGFVELSLVTDYGLQVYLKNHTNTAIDWWNLNLNLKTKIELQYYTNIIKSIIHRVPKKYFIQKDTTCSMAQHAGKLLGYKQDSLAYLNLSNENAFCDTYQIYINKLRDYLLNCDTQTKDKLNLEKILHLLSRDLLKSLIMTVEYGVSFFKAWPNYLNKVHSLPLSKTEREWLSSKELFKLIFNFFNLGILDEVFYLQTKETWLVNFLRSGHTAFQLSDITIPINYYKAATAILYYRTKNTEKRERVTIQTPLSVTSTTNPQLDKMKINNATYVNCIHSLDADYLRSIVEGCNLKGVPIVVIHDGFCVPFFAETTLSSIANTCFLANQPLHSGADTRKLSINSPTIIL